MKRIALLAWLVLVGAAWADMKITGTTTVPVNRMVRLVVDGAPAGSALIWDVSDEERLDLEEVNGRLLLTGPQGTYKVKVRSVVLKDGQTKIETARATVIIGEPTPPPPGPNPPDPPQPAKGNRVLIVYETADVSKMPTAQQSVLYAATVRAYLKANTLTDKDNPTGAWRIWDKDVDASAESATWQSMLKRERKSVPWVVIAGDKGVAFEGPLPADVDASLNLFKQYLGK